LKLRTWKLVKNFPAEEKYRLTDQLIRSTRGIGTAIAEGHGKFYYKDQINYCVIARGSLSETLNHLIDAMDSEYILKDELASFKIEIDEIGKLLNGYINFLRINLSKEKTNQ
jgi:four helix bundle protein